MAREKRAREEKRAMEETREEETRKGRSIDARGKKRAMEETHVREGTCKGRDMQGNGCAREGMYKGRDVREKICGRGEMCKGRGGGKRQVRGLTERKVTVSMGEGDGNKALEWTHDGKDVRGTCKGRDVQEKRHVRGSTDRELTGARGGQWARVRETRHLEWTHEGGDMRGNICARELCVRDVQGKKCGREEIVEGVNGTRSDRREGGSMGEGNEGFGVDECKRARSFEGRLTPCASSLEVKGATHRVSRPSMVLQGHIGPLTPLLEVLVVVVRKPRYEISDDETKMALDAEERLKTYHLQKREWNEEERVCRRALMAKRMEGNKGEGREREGKSVGDSSYS
ncbi:hypothetical protein K443DRAFT_124353 [Laccaria amethystina LaAM-08-1]|uniref:Uncharacterized protein n=1 Tax=Laccaria amethystina LaAM-08-1 TaxID=1095629 RepID=A0A0C9X606_9AGAR|nr:hypothetical protein K443DRAFT_124353 [Laccaria amethystina LaAM-08-1]